MSSQELNKKALVSCTFKYKKNRDIEVENKCMDTKGERGVGMNWEIGIDIHTLLILRIK